MSDPQFVSTSVAVSPAAPLPPAYGAVPVRQDEYDAVPPMSQGQRVLDTFFAPSRTFADIRRDRSWWLPYVLLVLFSLIFATVVQKRVGADTLADNAIRSNPAQAEKMQNAPPEQRAKAMKMTGTIMQVTLFSGALTFLLVPAVIALLIWVGFNFILGGSSTYPGMFAVAMYAALPGLIFYLVVIATLFAGDPETFNLSNATGTNIGYYLPTGTSPALKSLLTSIDVFSIWQAFLLGLGGAIVARVKKTTGLAMVFGVWLAIVLVKAGIAAI
ncbi:YIP1 family protein [Terriglobus sp.]|uniref:YIP1 family protein n=1 Tax=Terriglobus sp. TaxID=1889013 RepID=UPI003B003119